MTNDHLLEWPMTSYILISVDLRLLLYKWYDNNNNSHNNNSNNEIAWWSQLWTPRLSCFCSNLAAHCVKGKDTGEIVDLNTLQIFAGLHRIRRMNASSVQKRRVVQIIIHKHFDFILFESDLALLKLDRDLRMTRYVRPVCLPETSE